jgi:translation initiation factor IF-1
MSKNTNTILSKEGIIISNNGNSIFKVQLRDIDTIIIAQPSGKIRLNKIHLLPGDSVLVELSVYDLSRGRIVSRLTTTPPRNFKQINNKRSRKK